jgi:hypothetical protein
VTHLRRAGVVERPLPRDRRADDRRAPGLPHLPDVVVAVRVPARSRHHRPPRRLPGVVIVEAVESAVVAVVEADRDVLVARLAVECGPQRREGEIVLGVEAGVVIARRVRGLGHMDVQPRRVVQLA